MKEINIRIEQKETGGLEDKTIKCPHCFALNRHIFGSSLPYALGSKVNFKIACDKCGKQFKVSGKVILPFNADKARTKFAKDDSDKLRWDLLPIEPIEELIKVIMFGAKKYGDYNWQKATKEDIPRYYAALQRHLADYKKGETYAPDSHLPHLAHAMCNIVFMLYLERVKFEHIDWMAPFKVITIDEATEITAEQYAQAVQVIKKYRGIKE